MDTSCYLELEDGSGPLELEDGSGFLQLERCPGEAAHHFPGAARIGPEYEVVLRDDAEALILIIASLN